MGCQAERRRTLSESLQAFCLPRGYDHGRLKNSTPKVRPRNHGKQAQHAHDKHSKSEIFAGSGMWARRDRLQFQPVSTR